jgi:hypothetical protein
LIFHQTTINQKRVNYPLEGEALDYYKTTKNDQRRSASVLYKLGGLATHLKEHDVSIWCMGQRQPNGKLRRYRSHLDLFFYFITQFSFAVSGGLFLIIPLLIMVSIPGKTASVSCVSVIIFVTELATWSVLARLEGSSDFWFFMLQRLLGVHIGASFESKDITDVTLFMLLCWLCLLELIFNDGIRS